MGNPTDIWNWIVNNLNDIGVSVLGNAIFYVLLLIISTVPWLLFWFVRKYLIEPSKAGGKGRVTSITSTTAFTLVSFDIIPRTRELRKIKKLIAKNKKTVVHGLGGIGKTEICRELYAQCDAGEVPTVKKIGWIDYDGDLKSSFRKSFPDAGLESDMADEYHRKVLDHLKEFGNELLLFVDNFNTYTTETVRDIRSLPCNVLLTSRQEIDGMVNVLIDAASKAQCRRLYNEYSKAKDAPTAVLDEIIELAARHTLAVELLAKTQLASGKTAEEFLDTLTKSGLALTEVEETVDHAYVERRFIEHFSIVFDIAEFGRSNKDREELRVLRLMSLLAYQSVAKTELGTWLGLLDSKAINELVKKGWLTEATKTGRSSVAMPPIISAVVRYKKKPDFESAKHLVKELRTKLCKEASKVFTTKLHFLPHVFSVAEFFKKETDSEELVRLFHNLAGVYDKQGNYAKALECHVQILRFDHKTLGQDHPHFFRSRDNAEMAYQRLGRKEPFEVWLTATLAGE